MILKPLKINSTSILPRPELVRLTNETIKAMRTSPFPLDLHDTPVHIKNSRYAYVGHAYESVPYLSATARIGGRYLITIGLHKNTKKYFPNWNWGYDEQYHGNGEFDLNNIGPQFTKRIRSTWPMIEYLTWEMGYVGIFAHEAQHIQQYRNGWSRSEVDCHWASYEALVRVFGFYGSLLDQRRSDRKIQKPLRRKLVRA